MGETPDKRPANKVARLIGEYGLGGIGAELETRWTGDGVERTSLRDLAEFFNKRLLERAMLDAGTNALESDVETTYRNLRSHEVSAGVRTDTRNRLKRNGIDPDALESDFVTYQAIRSYLKDWRDAEYRGITDERKVEKDRESIQKLLTRTKSVTRERIEKLRETGRIDVEEFEVLLNVQVLCQRCETQYPVIDFLDHGGCDCGHD